jgi:hypothetical protein
MASQPYSAQMKTASAYISPLGFHRYASEFYVAMSDDHEKALIAANAYYNAKAFEYFEKVIARGMQGYPGLPGLDVLDDLACRLVSDLEPFIQSVVMSQ